MGRRFFFYTERIVKIGLVFLFFTIPLIFYIWNTTFTMTKDSYTELILLFIAATWLIKLLESRNYYSLKSPLNLPIIAFLFVLLISLFQTNNYYTSLVDLARWVSFILAYFILIFSFKERKWINALIMVVLFSGLISATYAIFQFYGIDFSFWAERQGRMRLFSTFGNPNYLSGYLAITLPLAFALFCIEKKKSRQIFLEILIAILYTGVFITNIGGWIALFMGILFMVTVLLIHQKRFLRENRFRLLVLILILSIISLIYSSPNPLNPTRRSVAQEGISYTNLEHSSVQQRFLIWLSSMQMIKEHPLLGSGIGTFRIHYPTSQGKVLSFKENKKYIPLANKSINAHNDYLHLWAETGIIGLTCFLWIVFLLYKKSFKYLKEVKKEDKFLLIGFMGMGAALLVDAVFSFPFHIIQNGMLFPFMLALSIFIGERKEETDKKEVNLKKKKFPLLLRRAIQISIVLLAIFLGILRVRIFIADTHIQKGRLLAMAKRYPQARVELEKAAQINPHDDLIYRYLGQVYNQLSEYEMAISAFKKAEDSWIYPLLYNNLGFAYQAMWQLDDAEKAFKKNIYLFPHRGGAYYNLGNLYVRQAESYLKSNNFPLTENKLDKALFYYEQARVFSSHFAVSTKVSELYSELSSRAAENKNKNGEKSIIVPSFFPGKKLSFLHLLKPMGEAGKPICIKLFYYHSQGMGKDMEAKIEIKDKEERIVKVLMPSKRRVLSDNVMIMSGLWQPEASKEEYYAVAEIKDSHKRILSEKRKFYIKEKEEVIGKIAEFEVNEGKDGSKILVEFIFENQGTIPLQIMGEVKIRDTKKKLIAGKQLGFKNVSPNSREEIKLTLEKDLIPGVYKAILIIIYGGNKVVKAEQFFLVSE